MTEISHSPTLPEVSFYVLATHDQQQRQDFACKLIEKIYRSGHFPYVLTDSAEQAEQIDKALWTFRAGSFIPHQIYRGEIPAFTGTILIGGESIPDGWQKIVVNLSSLYPPTTAPTERILEILDNSEECKQAGRQRYRHYQQAELAITTHKM